MGNEKKKGPQRFLPKQLLGAGCIFRDRTPAGEPSARVREDRLLRPSQPDPGACGGETDSNLSLTSKEKMLAGWQGHADHNTVMGSSRYLRAARNSFQQESQDALTL